MLIYFYINCAFLASATPCLQGLRRLPLLWKEPIKTVSNNTIEKKVWIQASAEIVFRALTSAKALEQWFCDKASSDPRAEGELVAHWNDGKNRRVGRAVFTRVDPLSVVALRWMDDVCGEDTVAAHTLSYEIHPRSGMTELVMTDSDETEMDAEIIEFLAQGWNAVLLELKDYCEHKERAAKKNSMAASANSVDKARM